MKLIIPENRKEITLGQYMEYMENAKDNMTENEMLDLMYVSFTNATDVDGVSMKDKVEVVDLITKAFRTESVLVDRFELNGVKYGRIPNYDKITSAEFNDLGSYSSPELRTYGILTLDYETLHRFVAINYREIDKEDGFNNYSIKSYEDTSNADIFKELPLSFVIGLESFFLTLHKDLLKTLQTSTEVEQVKETRPFLKRTVLTLLFLVLVTMTILHFTNY